MNAGQTIFSQLLDFLPTHEFNRCVRRYRGNYRVRQFSCRDQFLCMAFAQLTYRESLRDIETCLRSMSHKLYHAGFRATVARSTLADANELRDWRIYADFAAVLIARARELYAKDSFAVDLDQTVYAFDSTTIDLCLTLFPWAQFRRRKSAVKLHTLIDLRGNIPCFVHVSSGKMADVTSLDLLPIEAGAFYVMDRGYTDFQRLYRFTQGMAFFIIRAKRDLDFARREGRNVDKATGLRSDQTIVLCGPKTSGLYPDPLRRVSYYAADIDKRFVFLTNNFILPAFTIAQLYKCRWQVELFFKWIKQYLRIKSFYGNSINAVKTQVWIAVCVYVLMAI
ncbi:MAG: IS4 family transposase, partial [Phycisphaerae bacterium]|nr:IS4 family transposase [Phycisphaerae bacterium]